jgi:hypothetical protein
MSTGKWAAFSRTTRNTGIIVLFFLVGACVTVGDIQRTAPIRTVNFKGSATSVAQCIQQRLFAKVRPGGIDRYVVYDSVKNLQGQGLTHYSMTVVTTGPGEGVVEWRIVRSGDELDPAVEKMFWSPAKACAEQAKPEK